MKAGASAVEPVSVVDDNQYLRMNIDKGNQSRGGEAMVVIGNVAHPDVVDREYRIKTLDNANVPLTVNADEEGRVWLVVGTDSGFEGLSALYYSRISYQLSIVDSPATMTPESITSPGSSPIPTAIAVPTATPAPPMATLVPTPPSTLPDPPVTGGSPVPFWMLLALVGAAVLMVFIGVRVLATRGELEDS